MLSCECHEAKLHLFITFFYFGALENGLTIPSTLCHGTAEILDFCHK